MVNFNGVEVIKIENPTSSFSAVNSYSLKEFTDEVQNLEDGYYSIDGKEFEITRGEYISELIIPLWGTNPIIDDLKSRWERQSEEEEAEIRSEIIEFESDIETPLTWVNHETTMKSYYGKEIKIKRNDDMGIYELYLNDKYKIDIYEHEDEGTYSCYDGIDVYGRGSKTLKEAVKRFMDSNYSYDEEGYEPTCTSCGDGGCIHCEPHRFI